MSREVLLGPPGTGKTTELMGIVADLLAAGVLPERIAFVSYSRAAVAEARDRVVAKTGIEAKRWPQFRTLHSTWSRARGMKAEQFLTAADMRRFAAGDWKGGDARDGFELDARDESSEDAYIEEGEKPGKDAPLRAALEWCRASMVSPEQGIPRLRNPQRERDRYIDFCKQYALFRSAVSKYDHTDILEQALYERLRIDCDALIVDEAQDLSPLQQATLAPTLAVVPRAWVAGDDDQAIYEFQGASPRWLISLTRNQAWTTRILGKSWRCPEQVRAAAAQITDRLQERAAKDYAPRDGAGVYTTGATWDEAIAAMRNGHSGAFALARTKRGCQRLTSTLRREEIAYISERGGRSPLDPRGLRGLVDVLHDIHRGRPIVASAAAKTLLSPSCPGEGGKARTGVVARGGKTAIKAWAERLGASEVTIDLQGASALGLDRAMSIEPWALLASVRSWPQSAGDAANDLQWLRSLWDRHGGRWPAHMVTVTTWHGSKGREADLVVIDPALPYPAAKALDRGGDLADTEHRCAYVALTRARRAAMVIEDDLEAHGNYEFPAPRARRRAPEPAPSWRTFEAPPDDELEAVRAEIASLGIATGAVSEAAMYAWLGWRDCTESVGVYGLEWDDLQRAIAALPPPVGARLREALL